MQPKLIITFEHLNEADFLVKTGVINAALTGNPLYPVPWIAQVPSLETLNAAYSAYQDAYHAALTKDTLKIVLRDTLRAELTVLLKQLAPYLEVIAQGEVICLFLRLPVMTYVATLYTQVVLTLYQLRVAFRSLMGF